MSVVGNVGDCVLDVWWLTSWGSWSWLASVVVGGREVGFVRGVVMAAAGVVMRCGCSGVGGL